MNGWTDMSFQQFCNLCHKTKSILATCNPTHLMRICVEIMVSFLHQYGKTDKAIFHPLYHHSTSANFIWHVTCRLGFQDEEPQAADAMSITRVLHITGEIRHEKSCTINIIWQIASWLGDASLRVGDISDSSTNIHKWKSTRFSQCTFYLVLFKNTYLWYWVHGEAVKYTSWKKLSLTKIH